MCVAGHSVEQSRSLIWMVHGTPTMLQSTLVEFRCHFLRIAAEQVELLKLSGSCAISSALGLWYQTENVRTHSHTHTHTHTYALVHLASKSGKSLLLASK